MKNDGKRGIRLAYMERVRAKIRKKVEEDSIAADVVSFNRGYGVCGKYDKPFIWWYKRNVRNEGKPRPNWLLECARCWCAREKCDCRPIRDYRMLEAAEQEYKDWKNNVDYNEPLPDPFLKCEEGSAIPTVKTLEEVKGVLAEFHLSSFHDYSMRDGYIHFLGVHEAVLEAIKERLKGSGWEIEEVRHIPENEWYRVHIKPIQ